MSDSIPVDLASLRFHTPPGLEIPAIVEAFYNWAGKQPSGSLGYFALRGDRLDDFYVEDGSRQADRFVSFLAAVDGSRIGWWRANGEGLDDAPVVLLGGEGELRVLGRSTAEFLACLASGTTGVPDLECEGPGEGLERLQRWLRDQGVRPDAPRESELAALSQSVESWFEAWSEERRELARSAPERLAFAPILQKLIGVPNAEQPWERRFAELIITDAGCSLFRTFVGQSPVELPDGFLDAARALRDADTLELPDAGLWFRATLSLDSAGVLMLKRTYIEEPNPSEIALDSAGLRLDAKRKPRTAYWLPTWLAARLDRI